MASLVPKLSIPLAVTGDGNLATVEQGSPEEIEQCVAYILATPLGSRDDEPRFGVPDQVFKATVDVNALMAIVDEWEPRAKVLITDRFDYKSVLDRIVTVLYSIRGL